MKSPGTPSKTPTGWKFPTPDDLARAQSRRPAAKTAFRRHPRTRRGGVAARDAGASASGIFVEPGAARDHRRGRRQQGPDVGNVAAAKNKNSDAAPDPKH